MGTPLSGLNNLLNHDADHDGEIRCTMGARIYPRYAVERGSL